MKKKLACATVLCLLAITGIVVPSFAAENSLSPADKLFIREAASSVRMESQLGRVAQEKGHLQEVRDFGELMVADHGSSGDELKEIAAKKNVKLPEQLERKHRSMVAKLSRLTGDKFDRKYMKTMIKIHVKSVARFRKASKRVQDADLNAWAVKTLPVLEQHLQQAKDVAQKVGVR
jgi:putative membrane protein